MMEQKRGRNVAIAGLVLQFLFAAAMAIVFFTTDSRAALLAAASLTAGIPLWMMVTILLYTEQLVAQEQAELEELQKAGAESASIFQTPEGEEVRRAGSRLKLLRKWVTPIFTLIWVGTISGGAIALTSLALAWTGEGHQLSNAVPGTVASVLVAFVGFLFSFYALGMSRSKDYRLLRSVGSYMFVNTLMVLGAVAALISSTQGYVVIDVILAWLFLLLQGLLNVELVLALVLDLFRPRRPGEQYRPAFESRLFHLIADPSRVGHSIADTLNYQFGFEVSKTWFYQLLGKAMVPMVIFGIVAMLAVSSVVIVDEGEQGVIKRWGRVDFSREPLRPGLHFKLPWPVESVDYFDVKQVREILLGVGREREAEQRAANIIQEGTFEGREMMLWSKGHGQYEERDFLISDPAAQRRSDDDEQQLPPVNIIKLVVAVQYRVRDVSRWAYRYSDPERLLESVAYREMVRYCASATLATAVEGSDDERPEAIMTFGRAKAARNLKDRIIKAVGPEGLDLGVEITFVGIPSAHPPAETAEAFEQVLQADRQKEATIYEAEAWALAELAQVAGDPDFALKLAQHIRHVRALEVLLQLRDSPEDFRQMLDSYISLAEKDIQALEEDIERERMLSNAERMRFKKHLKNLIHTDYLQDTLHAIREDPDGFEYRRRLAEARRTAQLQLDRASGRAAAILAQARAYRWDKELVRRGETVAFQREMLAYQAAPRVYKLYRKLQVLDDVMPAIKKTVLAVPAEKIRQWLDHREATSGMQDITFDPEDAQTD